jgi:hypothetical protein
MWSYLSLFYTEGWSFFHYLDDSFTYHTDETANSLFPLSVAHFTHIVNRQGINVYEPFSNVLRAVLNDVLGGLNAHYLRIFSLFVHSVNSLLLVKWLSMQCDIRLRPPMTLLTTIGVVFFIHPLNVEPVGWLSAQGYIFSLLFSLLSTIYLEYLVEASTSIVNRNKKIVYYSVASVAFYVMASLSKAPAVLLPICQCLHILLNQRKFSTSGYTWMMYHFGALLMTSGIMLRIMLLANNETVTQYPEYASEFDFWIGAVIRSIVTIMSFTIRIFWPVDIRIHYEAPRSLDPLYHLSDMNTFAEYFGNFPASWIWMIFLGVAWTFLAFAYYLEGRRGVFIAWLSYLCLWGPTCGLIQHGDDQFGANRYMYFPLVYGIAPMILHLLHPTSQISSDDKSNSTKTMSKSKVTQGMYIVILAVMIFLLGHSSHERLESFKNDKACFLDCLRVDPNDLLCNFYISEWYGFHGNDYETGEQHRLRIIDQLKSEDKLTQNTLLYKGHMYVKLERHEDACRVFHMAYNRGLTNRGSRKQSTNNYAMAVNNVYVCRALFEGVTVQLVDEAFNILSTILEKESGVLRSRVKEKLDNNINKLQEWKVRKEPIRINFMY